MKDKRTKVEKLRDLAARHPGTPEAINALRRAQEIEDKGKVLRYWTSPHRLDFEDGAIIHHHKHEDTWWILIGQTKQRPGCWVAKLEQTTSPEEDMDEAIEQIMSKAYDVGDAARLRAMLDNVRTKDSLTIADLRRLFKDKLDGNS